MIPITLKWQQVPDSNNIKMTASAYDSNNIKMTASAYGSNNIKMTASVNAVK